MEEIRLLAGVPPLQWGGNRRPREVKVLEKGDREQGKSAVHSELGVD